jgi:hypothetical protein
VDTPEMLAAAERMLDEEEVRSGIGGI